MLARRIGGIQLAHAYADLAPNSVKTEGLLNAVADCRQVAWAGVSDGVNLPFR